MGDGWADIVDDDWDDESAWSEIASEWTSAPPPPADAAPPTRSRRPAELLCCPECRSIEIQPVARRRDRGTTTWRCRSCQVTWAEPIDVGQTRAYLARVPLPIDEHPA